MEPIKCGANGSGKTGKSAPIGMCLLDRTPSGVVFERERPATRGASAPTARADRGAAARGGEAMQQTGGWRYSRELKRERGARARRSLSRGRTRRGVLSGGAFAGAEPMRRGFGRASRVFDTEDRRFQPGSVANNHGAVSVTHSCASLLAGARGTPCACTALRARTASRTHDRWRSLHLTALVM